MNAPPLLVDLLVAFNLGLVSQLHCIGMCGGVVGALTLALDPAALASRSRYGFALAYNGGRISSYAIAGLALGALGAAGIRWLPGPAGRALLAVIAGLALVAAGFSIVSGRGPAAWLEQHAGGLWNVVRRPGHRLLPIRTRRHAWLFGMLWGWLPCALVYSTLVFASASASSWRGAAIMAAFGLGTAPAMLVAGIAGAQFKQRADLRGLRRLGGVVLIVAGLAYASMPLWMGSAAHHH